MLCYFLLKVFQAWSLGALSSWLCVLLICFNFPSSHPFLPSLLPLFLSLSPSTSFFLYCFLKRLALSCLLPLQYTSSSSCIFPAQPYSRHSPRSPSFFNWRMAYRNQIFVLSVLLAAEVSLLLGHLS